ncbi:unnamed protein product, partial [Meganyctiphanes norvegica]
MPASYSVRREDGWYVSASLPGHADDIESWLYPELDQESTTSLPRLFQLYATTYRKQRCMGTRKLIKREYYMRDGQEIEKHQYGEYLWRTYKDLERTVLDVGRGLRSEGLHTGARVLIFAETRAKTMIAVLGCLYQKMTVVTAFESFSDDDIIHIIEQCNTNLVITSWDQLPRMVKIIPKCESVLNLVILEDQLQSCGNMTYLRKCLKNIKIMPFQKLISPIRNPVSSQNVVMPHPEDIAFILYTRKGEGYPKGVEITHKNLLVATLNYVARTKITSDDSYLAVHPLSYIMEIIAELAFLLQGASILYSSPDTFTHKGPMLLRGTEGDITLACPTHLSLSPFMVVQIFKDCMQDVKKSGFLKQLLFWAAMNWSHYLSYIPVLSYIHYIMDKVAFKTLRDQLGGKLKCIVVCGDPLPSNVHDSFRKLFQCKVQIGYGLTETTGAITAIRDDDRSTGHVGYPLKGTLFRLQKEKGSRRNLAEHMKPRGEIIVGGHMVSKGYYRLFRETDEVFFEENGIRCFRTGDIGEIDKNGHLRIIGNKNNLIMKHGEYISVESTEHKLKTLANVHNICILTQGSETIGVVVTSIDRIRIVGASLGVLGKSDDELCQNEEIVNRYLKEINEFSSYIGIKQQEVPSAIHITCDTWTADNEMLTTTYKNRRQKIFQVYEPFIQNLFLQLKSNMSTIGSMSNMSIASVKC